MTGSSAGSLCAEWAFRAWCPCVACQCARFASSAWWTFLWLTQLCRGHHTHTNVCAYTHKHTLRDCIMASLQPPSIATILSWWSHFSLTHSQLKASTHALCRSAFTTAPSHTGKAKCVFHLYTLMKFDEYMQVLWMETAFKGSDLICPVLQD